MEKQFSNMLGLGLTVLAMAGFTPGRRPKHFMGVMNVDPEHSALRVPITAALLYAGSRRSSVKITRAVLTGVGAFYLVVGATGMIDKKAGGALPSKLTNFDIGYHFLTGLTALWLGRRSGRMLKP